MRVLGFMTGTSLDAVDMAVLETDGEAIAAFGPAGERKLSEAVRDLMLEATLEALKWERGAPEPTIFADAARAGAEEHFAAAEREQSWIARSRADEVDDAAHFERRAASRARRARTASEIAYATYTIVTHVYAT